MKDGKRYETPFASIVTFACNGITCQESTVDTGNGIKVPIENGDLEDGEEIA